MKGKYIILALAAMFAFACETTDNPADTTTDSDATPDSVTYGILSVDTTPAGATLYLNEEVKGTTPTVIADLTPGQYQVRITLAGYDEYSGVVDVASGTTTPVDVSLDPAVPTCDYDLTGRWVEDVSTSICDVGQDGCTVNGLCGASLLYMEGSSLRYEDADETITGTVADNNHVTIHIINSFGSDDLSYTRVF
ncbi:MAG: PEGA domain-containing protein [Patescibacteria group bacterium]|nr:PEGA domain-containing protein [Patescibacteria group bacterium]